MNYLKQSLIASGVQSLEQQPVSPIPSGGDSLSVQKAKLKINTLINRHKELSVDDVLEMAQKSDERQLMENTLFAKLGCDYLVARYALTLTDYQSIEAATEIIFGRDDDD